MVLNLEKTVWKGKPAVLSFYDGIIGGSFLTAISIAILIMFPHTALCWISVAGFAVGALMVAFVFVRVEANTYSVTDRSVREEYRLFTVIIREIPFEKITNIMVFQDVVGKALKFGDVMVTSAAGEPLGGVIFKGVIEPEKVKKKIMEARERALARKK